MLTWCRSSSVGHYPIHLDLIKDFSKLSEDAYEALRPSATEAAEIVLDKARRNVRDKAGTLSRSLKIIKPGKKKAKSGVIYARVTFGKDAAYGVPFGAWTQISLLW